MRAVGSWCILWETAVVASVVVLFAASASHGRHRNDEGARGALAAVSDGGATLVSVKQDTQTLLCVDNTGKNKPFKVEPEVPAPRVLALTPDGKVVAVGGVYGKIAVVRLAPKVVVQTTCDLKSQIGALAISLDGKRVAAADAKAKKVVIFDSKSGKEVQTLKHDETIGALRFSPDDKALAVGTEDGKCRVWSLGAGKLLWEAGVHKRGITCLAFFPCGKKMVVGIADGTVCIVDASTGKTLASYLAHRRTVERVAVSPDGKYVGSAGTDECINVWDAGNEKNFARVKAVGLEEPDLSFGKDSLFVAEGTALRLFNLKTKKLSEVKKEE